MMNTEPVHRKRLQHFNNLGHAHELTFSCCRTFWQPGGGFDRNLWNAKAIHESIGYIEANPVRKNLAAAAEEWKWSSAFGRKHRKGLIPDEFNMPVLMGNPQAQKVGVR